MSDAKLKISSTGLYWSVFLNRNYIPVLLLMKREALFLQIQHSIESLADFLRILLITVVICEVCNV